MQQVSLILLLRNGEKFLPNLLAMLDAQDGDFFLELVVVDSASEDQGLKLIKEFKSNKIVTKKIFEIKKEDFSHGGTRNFAVRQTTSDLVVFLSQDALPTNEFWLNNLLKHFQNKKIGGVFGRQLPWEKTNYFERYFYGASYPDRERIIDNENSENFSNQNLFFSNVNGAARRKLLCKFPFREDLLMSEDQFWGREAIKNGYQIIYEPQAAVWHAHNYTLKELFKRYYQSGYSQRQMKLGGNPFSKGLGTSFGLFFWVLKTKPYLLPTVMIYLSTKGGSFFLGRKKVLPETLEKKFLKS